MGALELILLSCMLLCQLQPPVQVEAQAEPGVRVVEGWMATVIYENMTAFMNLTLELENEAEKAMSYSFRLEGLYKRGVGGSFQYPIVEACSMRHGPLRVSVERRGVLVEGRLEAGESDMISVTVVERLRVAVNEPKIWRTVYRMDFSISAIPPVAPRVPAPVHERVMYPLSLKAEWEERAPVEVEGGFKVYRSKGDFRAIYWLSLSLYRDRLPLKSAAVWLAFWALMVVGLLLYRRKVLAQGRLEA